MYPSPINCLFFVSTAGDTDSVPEDPLITAPSESGAASTEGPSGQVHSQGQLCMQNDCD